MILPYISCIVYSRVGIWNVRLNLFININQLDVLNFIISLFQASTWFELMCSSSGGQKVYYTVSGVITPIGGRPVHGTATYRCDDTRGCIIQFCPPDDEHMCSKYVEAWNKLIIKFSASSWLILINKQMYIEMHGQQNIKKKSTPKCYFYENWIVRDTFFSHYCWHFAPLSSYCTHVVGTRTGIETNPAFGCYCKN